MLCGLETEYGLWIEGRGPAEQLEDAAEVVRSYPNPCFVGWDNRFESPRSDLRGFVAKTLSVDPVDAQYDVGRQTPLLDIRADRVLPSGARLYNDHGHPEYATAEGDYSSVTLDDIRGEEVVLAAARAFMSQTGRQVKVYKNNTDFHGASYGTHESYLVPREVPVETLMRSVVPMLVARQILTGAGKVGFEHGTPCDYQISQRAEFFSVLASVDTLYQRPIFNTRDEPHADSARWMRLHVISGDANRMPGCTQRKFYLVQRAIDCAITASGPSWDLEDPIKSMESVSKDKNYEFVLDTKQGRTTAYEIIESYLDESDLGDECRRLLKAVRSNFELFSRQVDWAAKKNLLELSDAPDPRAVDLAYSDLDPEVSLYQALVDLGEVDSADVRVSSNQSRSFARGLAVQKFSDDLLSVSWRKIVFRQGEVELFPDGVYSEQLSEISDVVEFMRALEGVPRA